MLLLSVCLGGMLLHAAEAFVCRGRDRVSARRMLPLQVVQLQPTTGMSSLWLADAEDLPNILGINPIEAALIAGVLYYVYGSEVLYEYAREAGRLFSLYAPVVKDVSLDIFNEFREYLEEDRERAALKKSGVDVESIPRRTTNIIEKFTETFAAFSDLTSGKKEAGELQEAYAATDQDVADSLSVSKPGENALRRKSKREVLESRNVNVERIMEATDVVTRGEDLSTVNLTDSISAVKDRFSMLGTLSSSTLGTAQDELGQVDDDWESTQMLPFPQEERKPLDLSVDAMDAEVGMSKFQQQMSGEWNDRVLRSDRRVEGEGLEDSFLQKWERVDGSEEKENTSVPQEISALDLYNPSTPATKSLQALAVLQEIDKDYLRLRQRLLDLMQLEVGGDEVEDGQVAAKQLAAVKKYWPPLAANAKQAK